MKIFSTCRRDRSMPWKRRGLTMSVEELVKTRAIAARHGVAGKIRDSSHAGQLCHLVEYHAMQSPNLKRTIDVLISNGASFDESTLQDLYATSFRRRKRRKRCANLRACPENPPGDRWRRRFATMTLISSAQL